MRAREIGLAIGAGTPGPHNAITDVEGVRIGMTTLVEGDNIRTGVTIVVPPPEPLIAGCHRLNGNGELTGLEWIRECGMLTSPIGITNTFYAVIEATEEAIVNALLAAETMTGVGGHTARALGAERLAETLRPFGVLC